MPEFISFSSSSQGNCSLIRCDNDIVLIDAGISAKKIFENLANFNIDLQQIKAILLTHVHSDHIKGLFNLLKKNPDLPLYLSRNSYCLLQEKGLAEDTKVFYFSDFDNRLLIGSLEIQVYCVPHVGVHPEFKDDPGTTVGFIIFAKGKKMSYFTDLGEMPYPLIEKMQDCDFYFIEANYDLMWEKACKTRPQYVVERNLSSFGHLSNDQTAEILLKLIKPQQPAKIMLGHISKDCNSEIKALDTVEKALKKHNLYQNVSLMAAPLNKCSEVIKI